MIECCWIRIHIFRMCKNCVTKQNECWILFKCCKKNILWKQLQSILQFIFRLSWILHAGKFATYNNIWFAIRQQKLGRIQWMGSRKTTHNATKRSTRETSNQHYGKLKFKNVQNIFIASLKTWLCHLIRYFGTLFWDDITIFWDES